MSTVAEQEKVKRKLNKIRIKESEEKNSIDKLGEETTAINAEDMETMFAGKICNRLLKERVAADNTMWAYIRAYYNFPEEVYDKLRKSGNPLKDVAEIIGEDNPQLESLEKMLQLTKDFDKGFTNFKNKASKVAEAHPLAQRMTGIKGLTPYAIALVMAHIKDIERFNKPSQLCMYAGCTSVLNPETGQWLAVTKGNIKYIDEIYAKKGKSFKGFNTQLAGRMFVIVESVVRQKGFFYNMYAQMRTRLEEGARNNGKCFVATKEDRKESKNVMVVGKEYMKGKKNQSLIIWSDKNAKRRIARTILHLLWKEWREIRGLEVVDPYVKDYLKHDSIITLDQVLKGEKALKKK